jgi:hypothetical protein
MSARNTPTKETTMRRLSSSWLLNAVRYGLPTVLVLAGIVVLCVADGARRVDGFAMLVGSGLSVALINVLFRFGASSDREREDEERAREYFSQHGYWPDEAPAADKDREVADDETHRSAA